MSLVRISGLGEGHYTERSCSFREFREAYKKATGWVCGLSVPASRRAWILVSIQICIFNEGKKRIWKGGEMKRRKG